MRGVLLDRDGVINRERPDYVKDWDEFEFLPGVLPALRRLAILDWPIVVITNQSAVGRGLVTLDTVTDIHRRMKAAVEAAGGRIDAVFVCPHHPDDGCACRKPRSGLLRQAAEVLDLQLVDCYLIGDAPSDLLAARAVGCRPILIQGGVQGCSLPQFLRGEPDVLFVPDLAHAVTMILAQEQPTRHRRQACLFDLCAHRRVLP